jgi:hypothetical protein
MALVVVLQYRLGGFSAEFGNDDSSSHYASGLLVHDYLAAGIAGSPLAFVRRFHSSYPIVGIGHWGPAYYTVEGIWMLLFGCGRDATILLSGVVTATVALLLYAVAAPRFGRVQAGLLAGVYVLSPIVQRGSDAVMLDGSITLVCLLGLLAYRRYLETGRARYSLLFGLLAAAGLLVKGNAACLALLPVFALAIGGDWRPLHRWSFWLPAAVVPVLVGPWYWLTYAQIAPGFRYHWGWSFTSVAVPANLGILLNGVGPLLLAAGAAGWVMVARRPPPGGDRLLLVVTAALFAAGLVFQSIVPAALEGRYLAPALPPLLLLAAFAVQRGGARWLRGPRRAWGADIAVALLCLGVLPGALALAPKRQFGLVEAARRVWAARVPDNPSVLVVADGAEEGAAVAELAMRDPARPSLFAVRGSRLLGGGGYNTEDYVPRFHDPRAVIAAIDSYAIPLVLIRTAPGHNGWAHIDQVAQARALQPTRWELLYQGDGGGPDGAQVQLYRLGDNATRRADVGRLEALSAPRHLAGARGG